MRNKILCGDALTILKTLPDAFIQCCITSPPYYGLRDYGVDGQLGLEKTPEEYVTKMVEIFGEVRRVLKDDGTLWLNLGDSYAGNVSRASTGGTGCRERREGIFTRGGRGLKNRDLIGIPWRVAFALQKDGWYLRQDIIWSKPNPMPESVTNRCTKSHEYIFLLTQNARYYYNAEAIKERSITNDGSIRDRDNTKLNNTPGRSRMAGLKTNDYPTRNLRSVWSVSTRPFRGAHFATFPENLIWPMVLAGTKRGDLILDPLIGSGTVGVVAKKLNRDYLGIELNPKYVEMAEKRIAAVPDNLFRSGVVLTEEAK